jgi:hypothetical protein
MAGRIRQVHGFFRQRAPAQLLATAAAPHSSPWLPEGHGQNYREAALAQQLAVVGRELGSQVAQLAVGHLADHPVRRHAVTHESVSNTAPWVWPRPAHAAHASIAWTSTVRSSSSGSGTQPVATPSTAPRTMLGAACRRNRFAEVRTPLVN